MSIFKKVWSIVTLLLFGLCIVIYCYLTINDGTLYIFDRFFNPNIFLFLVYMLLSGESIYLYIRSPQEEKKEKKPVAGTAVMLIISVLGIGSIIYFAVKDPPYTVSETLPDGTVILLSEHKDYLAGFEKNPKNELTYLDVYRLKGFKAVKLGDINETYFSNKCLAQDKYTLDYNEEARTVTVACEYGVYGNEYVHLKEEFDTGVMTYDFIIS